jgi:hypothetical protein
VEEGEQKRSAILDSITRLGDPTAREILRDLGQPTTQSGLTFIAYWTTILYREGLIDRTSRKEGAVRFMLRQDTSIESPGDTWWRSRN